MYVSTVAAVQCWPTCIVHFVGHLSIMWLTFADLFLSFRILHVQPSAPSPHDGDTLLPYARRWTRGIDRDTESHHVLISIRDQLDRMMEDQFRWIPYNEILHTLLCCCTINETLWMACVPILCLEIVEVHTHDRVMRQFGRPQHVPAIPSWGTNHHVHDQRRRLGPEVLEMLDKYFDD
ncbi:hypothetical protein KY290_013507 [Solanum tuberosum]|uniref:Aminotransferase-like plant mobile domain-containing protein n=1 Tax=Solanum tuberosum TaxID=4113 RepID=A0ABQ7VLX4_SOLTU|nr:hypothetical protein KY285_012971 [Solanum tuberosum]KAH0769526.1 hypothetical protein KY290_013507 [Solanum tuberosum]